MTKSRRIKREGQREAFWAAWADYGSQASGFASFYLLEYASRIGDALNASIGFESEKHAKLTGVDELSYMECVAIRGVYRDLLNVSGEIFCGVSPQIQEILEGLNAVLTSRIGLMDEAETDLELARDETEPVQGDPCGPLDKPNPVAQEKLAVLADMARRVNREVIKACGEYAQTPACADAALNFARAFLLERDCEGESVGALAGSFYSAVSAKLHETYGECAVLCLSGLDDLHKRKAASFYIGLMESELEVAGDLLKFQAAALESAALGEGAFECDRESIQRIIEPLALAHRRLDKSLYEIRRALSDERRSDPLSQNESEERGFPLTAAEFNAVSALNPRYIFLNEIGETNKLFKELTVKKELFLSALETETEELFEQIRLAFAKAAYRFQRLVSVEAFLADDLSEIFDYLLRDLPKSDAYPEGIERDILSGIIETLQIKTESIRDGVAAFHADGARLVGEFTSGLGEEAFDKNRGAGPDGGGRTPAFAAVLSLWAGRAPSEKDSVQPFFDECFRLETFEGYASKQDKRAAEYQSKIDKLVLQFKKETILYEVNTYEEIITYSVSRLRQLTDENTQKAVALFDGAVASLGMLLKKNNIRQINPSPHEPFNGREHEVLIAEKQEGFGKGEIIKVINSGYQYKDTILMRANVIAAK